MVKEILIEFLPEKAFCVCGNEGVYSVWGWSGIHKDYISNRVVCRTCGDELSRQIQEGEIVEMLSSKKEAKK